LWNTIHRPTARITFQLDTIDIWFMKFHITNIPDGFFLKIHFRFRCVLMVAIATNPDRKRSPPETIPSDIPINKILEEFSETTVLNMIGIPFYFLIVDRKSTRLNSSHVSTSYAVFCLK